MAQPQYTFDPVTQTYTRVDTPPAPITGLGPLYKAGENGADSMAPSGSRGPGQGISPTLQNIGLAGLAYSKALGGFLPGATLVGLGSGAILDSQLEALGEAQANLGAMDAGRGRSMGIATVSDPAGNTYGRSSPASIDAVDQATFGTTGAQNATAGLASMNAQTAAQQNAQAQQAAVANTAQSVASSVAQDVADVADMTDAQAGADNAAAAAVSDSGNTSDGGGGPGTDGYDAADPSNAGESSDDTYAGGGLASARKTEDMGRGNDTMLVHMTPGEVRGLQAIARAHGGSLTINPKTGLVEAGFLESILPMVAGAALAATGVGAPMAALMVGGGATLMTGSLEKGLMAGLGAFGGAGIGAGLAASATAPAVTGTQAGLSQAGQAFQAAQSNIAPELLETMSAQQVAGTMPAAAQAQLAGQGAQNLLTEGGRQAFATGVKEATGLGVMPVLGAAAAPVATSMFSAEEPDTGKKQQEYIRPYGFDLKPTAETDPNFKFRTGKPGESTAEQRYFTPTFTPMGVFKAGTEPGGSFYGTPTEEQLKLYSGPKPTGVAMAAGGLKDGAFVVPADVVSHLGNGSNDAGQKLLARGLGARPIKGKGDGMSDSIPTTIEGKQPARVADGEAYIPPEVVKKVGAKRLYSMMDKIRHARTGSTKQAPEVDPRKFLPA